MNKIKDPLSFTAVSTNVYFLNSQRRKQYINMSTKIVQKNAYQRDELLACGHGKLFGEGNARLPLPNMLMFDRITHIATAGGQYNKGIIIAELDIHPDLWFFDCHFENDPVMPGCLGLDALWQLLGFYLGWCQHPGKGRALGCGEVKFTGQILPTTKIVAYEVSIRRVMNRGLVLGMADATVKADGEDIYSAKSLRVGLFQANSDLSSKP